MRLRPLFVAAVLATTLSVPHALAFTFVDSNNNSNGASRIADPDQQLNTGGWQVQTQVGRYNDPTGSSPNTNLAPNGSSPTQSYPGLFAPFDPSRR
jgi:hypothetical protein